MNKPVAAQNVTEKPGGEGATPGFKPVAAAATVSETLTETISAEVVEKPGGEGATPGSKRGSNAS